MHQHQQTVCRYQQGNEMGGARDLVRKKCCVDEDAEERRNAACKEECTPREPHKMRCGHEVNRNLVRVAAKPACDTIDARHTGSDKERDPDEECKEVDKRAG